MASLDPTMGVLLVGVILAGSLWGVCCVQTFNYYMNYSRDPLRTKLLVAAVWFMETVHQGLIIHTVYWYLVSGYGEPGQLDRIAVSLVLQVFFEVATAVLVQGFFTVRIWRLRGRRVIFVIPVALLIMAKLSASIIYGVKGFSVHTFEDLRNIESLSIMMNASAAATDVTIAVILCTTLQNSKTGFEKSDSLVNKLITFAVNTGLLTSTCAGMSLVTILVAPESFAYMCFFFLMGRLYSNSLLATLNARKRWRDELEIAINEVPNSAQARAASHGQVQSSISVHWPGSAAGLGSAATSPTESVDVKQTDCPHVAIRVDTDRKCMEV